MRGGGGGGEGGRGEGEARVEKRNRRGDCGELASRLCLFVWGISNHQGWFSKYHYLAVVSVLSYLVVVPVLYYVVVVSCFILCSF